MYDDDDRLPEDPWGGNHPFDPEDRPSFAPVYNLNTSSNDAVRNSLMGMVNETELTLMGAPGEVSAHYMHVIDPSYGGGSSVSTHNEPCEVCGTKGMRRKWKYDPERGKMVKDGMVSCDACQGKGWSVVATTTYHPSPYWVTNDVTPNVPAMPQPYPVPLSPTVAPSGVPFYGSTTDAPPVNY
jgi:hypothetical protein